MSECNVCHKEHPGMKHWVSNWAAYRHMTDKPSPPRRKVSKAASRLLSAFEESVPWLEEMEVKLPTAA